MLTLRARAVIESVCFPRLRRGIVVLMFAAFLLPTAVDSLPAASSAEPPRSPNIVFILADDKN